MVGFCLCFALFFDFQCDICTRKHSFCLTTVPFASQCWHCSLLLMWATQQTLIQLMLLYETNERANEWTKNINVETSSYMEWTQKIKFSVLRLSLWCVLWGTSCLLFVYVRHFSKHFYSIIFSEALENVSTWKTEIYILFFIMKNIAEWIFINTLFAFAVLRALALFFLDCFYPYPFTIRGF